MKSPSDKGGASGSARLLGEGGHAAALRVSEHDDVPHLERHDGVFERRRRAVIVVVRLVGRDQIRDVAQHEQFPGAGVEDGLRRDPRIAAADDHRPRALTFFGEFAKPLVLAWEAAGQESLIALDEMAGKFMRRRSSADGVDHCLSSKGRPRPRSRGWSVRNAPRSPCYCRGGDRSLIVEATPAGKQRIPRPAARIIHNNGRHHDFDAEAQRAGDARVQRAGA